VVADEVDPSLDFKILGCGFGAKPRSKTFSNRLNAVFGMKLLAEALFFAVETVRLVNVFDVAIVAMSLC
jgi:hypothetical protein